MPDLSMCFTQKLEWECSQCREQNPWRSISCCICGLPDQTARKAPPHLLCVTHIKLVSSMLGLSDDLQFKLLILVQTDPQIQSLATELSNAIPARAINLENDICACIDDIAQCFEEEFSAAGYCVSSYDEDQSLYVQFEEPDPSDFQF